MSALVADALEMLRLQSRVLGRLDLESPWGIRFTGDPGWFHIPGRNCLVELPGEPRITAARPGDLLFVLPGNEHFLRDSANAAPVPLDALRGAFRPAGPDWLAPQAGQQAAALVCGCFMLESLELTGLPTVLPKLIRIPGTGLRPAPFVDGLVRLIFQESTAGGPWAEQTINRLVQILLIKAVQEHISTADGLAGDWLRAVRDPAIGRTLALMHDHLAAPWTVASLAERAAISRTSFAARFTALVGKSPLRYLYERRMLRAAHLLRTAPAELKEVAASVGYESAAAFGKAFARWAGVAPGVYRRHGQAREAAVGRAAPSRK